MIRAPKATEIYRNCLRRWRIAERFSTPDWSIVDLWVAWYLLSQCLPATQVEDIVRHGSPQFPREHGDPNDYLRRTLARAAFPFPPRGRLCDRFWRLKSKKLRFLVIANTPPKDRISSH